MGFNHRIGIEMEYLRKCRGIFLLFQFAVLLSSQVIMLAAVAKLGIWEKLAHLPVAGAAVVGTTILAFFFVRSLKPRS